MTGNPASGAAIVPLSADLFILAHAVTGPREPLPHRHPAMFGPAVDPMARVESLGPGATAG